AEELAARLAEGGAGPDLRRRALLLQAEIASTRGDYGRARSRWETFFERHPDDPAAPEALHRAALIASGGQQDYPAAAALHESHLRRYPRSPLADDACAAAAECRERSGEPGRALLLWRRLLAEFPSSDLTDQARTRILDLLTFQIRDTDAGLEKLALLVGDVIAAEDPEGLPFRLGEVYFRDLKNYAAAASRFSSVINGGLRDDRFAEALLYRSRALEYLSWKDSALAHQAAESYETFLAGYAGHPRAEEAALSLFLLRSRGGAQTWDALGSTLAAFPSFSRRDTLLLVLAGAQEASDSLEAALATCATILREHPASPSAEEALFRRLRLFEKLGRPDSALASGALYVGSFSRGPHAAAVLASTGRRALEASRHELAVSCFRTLGEDFFYARAASDASRLLARALEAGGAHEEAVEVYRSILREQEENPLRREQPDAELVLSLGASLHAAGDRTGAQEHLMSYLRTSPSPENAGRTYALLGELAREGGDRARAASYIRLAAAIAPSSAATVETADLLFEGENYAEALTRYRLLAEAAEGPERRRIRERIILCRLRLDQDEGIEKEISSFGETYRDAGEELGRFELARGTAAFRRKDYAAARRFFDRVLDRFEETSSAPAAMYWSGKILEASSRTSEAEKLYDRILKEHPSDPVAARARVALGNIYYTAEKWDAAVQSYRSVVEDPQADPALLPFAMSNLIETYEAAGAFDAALALARKYLERYPENEDSFDKRIKIGILYQRLGYHEQSIIQLESLLDRAGGDVEGELRYYIGEAYYGKGDYQQAILEFLKVPYLVTKKGKLDWTANALYMAGQAYEKMGRHDQALTMYRQITERPGIDETFKAAARKEMDRVRTVLGKK
ncbi:MAG: tetratricopeptide repeat protein, partial [Bacteroidota bacterium]